MAVDSRPRRARWRARRHLRFVTALAFVAMALSAGFSTVSVPAPDGAVPPAVAASAAVPADETVAGQGDQLAVPPAEPSTATAAPRAVRVAGAGSAVPEAAERSGTGPRAPPTAA